MAILHSRTEFDLPFVGIRSGREGGSPHKADPCLFIGEISRKIENSCTRYIYPVLFDTLLVLDRKLIYFFSFQNACCVNSYPYKQKLQTHILYPKKDSTALDLYFTWVDEGWFSFQQYLQQYGQLSTEGDTKCTIKLIHQVIFTH